MQREIVVASVPALAAAFAARVAAAARAAALRGRFSLALSGGSVAPAFLPALGGLGLDPDPLEVFWIDERAVPPDHPDSNYALAARLWLDPAGVPAERRHRMPADAADLAVAAAAYERELVRCLGKRPRLDLALLGVGPDGHVASLFPGHPLLAERRRLVAAVEDSPKPPPRRLTLTLPALTTARTVVVAAFGEAKAGVMRAALDDPASELPVALVLRAAASSLVLLDPAAAP